MRTGLHRRWQKLLLADQLKNQQGICPICAQYLPEHLAVVDRYDRIGNFTPSNVRALHVDCDALVTRRRAAGNTVNAIIEAAE